VAVAGFYAVWSTLLLVGLFFLFRWIVAVAVSWLTDVVHIASPRPVYVASLTVAGVVLAAWVSPLFLARDVALGTAQLGTENEAGLVIVWPFIALWSSLTDPLTMPALIGLWSLPMAARFWRGRANSMTSLSWAFLDSSPQQLMLPPAAPFRLVVAIITGLIGGVVFCILLIGLAMLLHANVPEATRNTENFVLGFLFGLTAMAALVQVGVSVVVAAWVRRLPALHGLFAAFVGACIMAGGILALAVLSPCIEAISLFSGPGCPNEIDTRYVWDVFSETIGAGALLSLPFVLVVSGLAGWVRRRHQIT
jgi:hypothetical protein